MNASKLADIAEITSSIAILVTLVFLVIQMQQNTEAIQANGRQANLGQNMQFLAAYITDPTLEINRYKAELTDPEKVQLHFHMLQFIRMRELNWIEYQGGILDENTWLSHRRTILTRLRTERWRNWWQGASAVFFDRDFVAHVNEALAGEPVGETGALFTWIE